ncbi:ParB/RepB/Spo0J family partition protein [Bifidobacterium moukalabense]|uniref:ParB/RepB/Spo0J family partition protein n=1 Tax=Bifidobacterium moukalabense TaxID=1333651 RepID=UPI0010F7FE32|nr:ParB/RepB/Spo0J family partition protein [Bifidobacterium moukalabense]
MATKSRLGKGLGALFPALPGENQKHEDVVQEPQVTAEKPQDGKTSVATAQASVDAVHGMKQSGKKSVSRETAKKTSGRRNAMPSITLNETAHPADMFFGGSGLGVETSKPTADKQTGVSRETESSKKGDEEPELLPVQGGYLVELRLSDVGPNLHQPRTIFDEDDLRELADSIKEVGVLQPIVVRKRPSEQIEAARKEQREKAQEGANNASEAHNMFDGRMDSMYELIMGERRWRASQIAGLKTIPAIVKTTSDDDMLRDALLENLHRVALNPLEEAAAYQQMIDDFGLTQAQLSKSVSKSRPQIANTLRLLHLPAVVQKKVASGLLSAGHARALLGLPTESDMEQLSTRIISEGLSVRSTEEIVSMKVSESDQPKKPKASKLNPWAGTPVQVGLEQHFGTKVSIKGSKKHGRIEIVFKSEDDMNRIVDLLMQQHQ